MGYLSSSSPLIISGAISALSLLIYSDADYCLAVPNLIPSVIVLLQNKSNEVIKVSFFLIIVPFGSSFAFFISYMMYDLNRQLWDLSKCWFPPCILTTWLILFLIFWVEYFHCQKFQDIISNLRYLLFVVLYIVNFFVSEMLKLQDWAAIYLIIGCGNSWDPHQKVWFWGHCQQFTQKIQEFF